MIKYFLNTSFLKISVATLSLLALTACPGGGGGGEITLTNRPSTDGGTLALTVSTVNSKDSSNWIADANGVPYSTTVGVTFAGTCTRGVSKINAYINSSETAETTQGSCDNLGKYSIVVTLPTPDASTEREGVVHTVVLKPVLPDGTVGEGSASRTVNIDTHGPTFGAITHSGEGSGPYSVSPIEGQNSASFTVTGTVSSDAVNVTGTSSVATGFALTFSGVTYTAEASIGAGGQDLMVITAYDVAGNSSASSSIVTDYVNSINLPAWLASSSAVGGGVVNEVPTTQFTFIGTVGGLGSEVTGDYQVILGTPGVYTKYNP